MPLFNLKCNRRALAPHVVFLLDIMKSRCNPVVCPDCSTVSQYKQKFGTLKRQHQKDKQKNAHLLEEARKREEDIGTDAEHLKVIGAPVSYNEASSTSGLNTLYQPTDIHICIHCAWYKNFETLLYAHLL